MKAILMTVCALAVMFTVRGAVYEAEDFADAENARILADADASGGKCVELCGPRQLADPAKAAVSVRWKFSVEKKGLYDLRVRLFARHGGCDSVFAVLDDGKAQTVFSRLNAWYVWEQSRVFLSPGEHTLILKTRETGMRADSLEVVEAERYPKSALERFPAPPVWPVKGEHPRVLLRKQDLSVIRARLEHPENADIWRRVKELAAEPTVEKLDPAKHTAACGLYNEHVLRVIEAKAFVWLMEGDRAAGESAVKSMLGVFGSSQFKRGFQDISRQLGESIFVAGLVYDWCYPLMTPEQRAWVIERAEELCGRMEVGFPPVRQGNVTSHGGEAQIYRDLFCYGIAVYDECPEMYRVAAGRMFSEMTESRRFFYPAGRHHQGCSYGPYRYTWEMFAAQAVRRLCGMELYDRHAAEMAYDWLYNRTPDGAILQVGDNFFEFSFAKFFPAAAFYLYSWSRSPLAKAEFLLQNGMSWARNNPVIYLVLNEPDVMPAKVDDLPLTHYFPMPLPAMTARSGWGFGGTSDLTVVEMIGAGYQINSHQHQDAGSFQIYHRGLLAADLGQYGRYGDFYDWNFNKQSISHNLLRVRDPRGKDGKAPWPRRPTRAVIGFVGGQLWPDNGDEPADLGVVRRNRQIGDTTTHAFGPDGKLPLYSHLKCDLSQAYGTRVKRYFRSFVYVNTNDPEVPAVLTVFDHATATDPAFEKIWNLNTYLEPAIAGNSATVTWDRMGYDGQMKVVSLLPENAVLSAVPALTVCGRTFTAPHAKKPSSTAFRTEIRPKTASATDTFLTVMGVGKAGRPLAFEAKTIPGKAVIGAAFKNFAVYFSADARLLTDAFELAVPEGKDVRAVVTDLAPGAWEAVMAGKVIARRRVPAADGTLFFVAPQGGTATIRPAEGAGPDTDYSALKAVPAAGERGIVLDGKKISGDPPRNLRGQLYVPVRPLAGPAFQARKDGFELDRSGVRCRFTAKSPYVQTGKYRFFVDAEPVFADGEWLYPAETLATVMHWSLGGGVQNAAIRFRTIAPEPGVVPVVAANSPQNCDTPLHQLFDGDPATYWGASGSASAVTMFLGEAKPVGGVRLLWRNGGSRSYKFEILTSQDGKNFTEVWKGQSEKTGGWETVRFAPVRAAFVRLVGHGSQVNDWTSICELRLLAPEQ